jgi:hypothetical protein
VCGKDGIETSHVELCAPIKREIGEHALANGVAQDRRLTQLEN